ncbi:AAA family ATPase [Parvibaculum sp.]|uniref:ATP-dependent nuclease n=1 Tax=Parvibaculum sp. TaxID=2024848 RepID=UPI0032115CFD
MKVHKADDFWRALKKAPAAAAPILSMKHSGLLGVAAGEITFQLSLTAFCGPNGIGKTTLLRALWATLAPQPAQSLVSTKLRLKTGSVTLQGSLGDEQIEVVASFADGNVTSTVPEQILVEHVDTSSCACYVQNFFCDFPNIEDTTNGEAAFELTSGELEEVRYLTAKDYNYVRIYEVDDGADVIPLFTVNSSGLSYDVRTMGLGELSALYLWWVLRRSERGTFLLIEEPESFLTPSSQVAFLNHLASKVVRNKLFSVLTSHSPEIIGMLPEESIRFFYRDGQNSVLAKGDLDSLLQTIGLTKGTEFLFLVEDRGAALFGKLWLDHFDASLARRTELVALAGESAITLALRNLPDTRAGLRMFGLYDGDVRDKVPKDVQKKALFLPGNIRMEQKFRQMTNGDVSAFEEILGKSDIKKTLFALNAHEDHDWFDGLAKILNRSYEQLMADFFKWWISVDENVDEAALSFEKVKAMLLDSPLN